MGVVKLSTAGILNFQKYSSMRAGIPLPPARAFDLLETQVLASSAASVTFSSLSTYAADYQHLQIRVVARSTRSSLSDPLVIRFNGDSATNYNQHNLHGDGSSVFSEAAANSSSMQAIRVAGASQTTGNFGAGVVDILDPFEATKFTTIRSLTGVTQHNYIMLKSGAWRNTNALTSIQIFSGTSSSLVTGSRFSLYGLKAGA